MLLLRSRFCDEEVNEKVAAARVLFKERSAELKSGPRSCDG